MSSSSSPSSSTSLTSSAAVATHTVTVGVDGFTYNPTSLTANIGDAVIYIFYPQNHSVARAEYGFPCIPYENTGPNKVGFWSGFRPVDKPSENAPTFSIRINSTEPIFFYCSAPGACVPNGMIGVINPNDTQSLANQQTFVHNARIQLSPGEENPPESIATSTPSSSSSGISRGAIAGIAIAALAVLALVGLAFYLCSRNRTLASILRYSQPPQLSRPQIIPPDPNLSTKQCQESPRSGLSAHDEGQIHSTTEPLQPTNPEMVTGGGMISPQSNSGYNAVESPGNWGHPSPSATSWQQHGGYNYRQTQLVQEMQEVQEVHELDVISPPQYAHRKFSFSEGTEAHGVEKILRD